MRSTYRGHVWNNPPKEGLRVLNCAEYTRPGGGQSTRILHSCWALDLVIKGATAYKVKDRRRSWRKRRPGELHLYAPGTPYWEDYRPAAKRVVHSIYICFQGGEAFGLPDLLHGRLGFARIQDPLGLLAGHLRDAVDGGQEWGAAGFFRAQAALYRIVELLYFADRIEEDVLRVRENAPAPKRKASEFVTRIEAYLEARLNRTVALEDLARHSHASISTISHKYKEETGESPLTTHIRMRINRVKQLLSLGTPMKVIAEQMGFSDIYHLSKSFKKVVGVSPRAYLKSGAPA